MMERHIEITSETLLERQLVYREVLELLFSRGYQWLAGGISTKAATQYTSLGRLWVNFRKAADGRKVVTWTNELKHTRGQEITLSELRDSDLSTPDSSEYQIYRIL